MNKKKIKITVIKRPFFYMFYNTIKIMYSIKYLIYKFVKWGHFNPSTKFIKSWFIIFFYLIWTFIVMTILKNESKYENYSSSSIDSGEMVYEEYLTFRCLAVKNSLDIPSRPLLVSL